MLGSTHVVPHVPQLLLSVCRFVHVPAQSVNGAAHTHELFEHVRLPPHVAMQLPQLTLFVDRFEQVAARPTPHWVVGGTQETTHVPSEQSGAVAGHALPHAPQFALFAVRTTQLPAPRPRPGAHWVSPAGQPQVPSTHAAPSGHPVPHAPQLALFVERSTHAFPPRPIGHDVSPPSPQPATHAPLVHVGVPPRHTLPQRPQLALSACGFTHVAPQSRSPAGQPHMPFVQSAPFGHCKPQPPQLSGSLPVLTHALPHWVSVTPASVVPHAVPQIPPEQSGVAAGHTFPHAPQLFESLWIGVQMLFAQRTPPFEHWHEPAWQLVPAPQRVLQVPQLALLFDVSMHAFPHWVRPAGQTHAPPAQTKPALHTTPQPPQLLGSVWSGMHAPLQYAWPAGHVHAPFVQVDVPPHLLPHAPQFWLSFLRLTQVPLQFVSPA